MPTTDATDLGNRQREDSNEEMTEAWILRKKRKGKWYCWDREKNRENYFPSLQSWQNHVLQFSYEKENDYPLISPPENPRSFPMRKSPSSITNNLIPREEDESVYYRTIYSTGHSLDGPVPFRSINYRVNGPDHVLYKYLTKNRVNGNRGPFIDNRLGFGLGNQNYACHSTTFF